MANEYVSAAANNLRHAAADLTQQQRDKDRAIIESRSDADNKIRDIRNRINVMQQTANNEPDKSRQSVQLAEIGRLNSEISDIQSNSEKIISDLQAEISSLEGKLNELESTASRVEMLA